MCKFSSGGGATPGCVCLGSENVPILKDALGKNVNVSSNMITLYFDLFKFIKIYNAP